MLERVQHGPERVIPISPFLSFVLFWRTVKNRVPMREYGKLFPRK
jgi:hypothetical protein